jgi:hypothetical protein
LRQKQTTSGDAASVLSRLAFISLSDTQRPLSITHTNLKENARKFSEYIKVLYINTLRELLNLNSSIIITMIKPRGMRWTGHVARMEQDYTYDFGEEARRKEITRKT